MLRGKGGGGAILPLSKMFPFDYRNVPNVGLFVFHFISRFLGNNRCFITFVISSKTL